MKRAHVQFLFAVFIVWVLFETINMAIEDTIDKGPASLDVLVASFDDINFTKGNRNTKRSNLDKWQKEVIHFDLVDDAPEWVRETISSHLARLEKITGLQMDLSRNESSDQPEVTIRYLEPVEAYDQVIAKVSKVPQSRGEYYATGRCRVYVWNDPSGMIRKGMVLIVPNDDKKFEHSCIIEELTQVLGLTADRAHYLPAIFSNEGLPQKLSVNDMIMIRTLYDSRLKAGVAREEALIIARQVINELVGAYIMYGEEALYQR